MRHDSTSPSWRIDPECLGRWEKWKWLTVHYLDRWQMDCHFRGREVISTFIIIEKTDETATNRCSADISCEIS